MVEARVWFERVSLRKSRSPLRPGPGGSPEPSLGRKLFIDALASIRVPFTETWSLDNSPLTGLSANNPGREARAPSVSISRSMLPRRG